MYLALDLIEIMAVFFLAVEAIKLENLSKLSARLLTPILERINPIITFVDNIENEGLFDRSRFWLFFFGFYMAGNLIFLVAFYYFNIDMVEWFKSTSGINWLWVIPSVILAPIFVGLLLYTCIVVVFDLSIKGLTMVESHTSTGVVGIVGFALYLIQLVVRRLLAP